MTKNKSSIYKLTKRNKDVLRLIWMPSNKDIADVLCVSPSTVATHLVRIRQIMGTKTRAETLVVALNRRFITINEIIETMKDK